MLAASVGAFVYPTVLKRTGRPCSDKDMVDMTIRVADVGAPVTQMLLRVAESCVGDY